MTLTVYQEKPGYFRDANKFISISISTSQNYAIKGSVKYRHFVKKAIPFTVNVKLATEAHGHTT